MSLILFWFPFELLNFEKVKPLLKKLALLLRFELVRFDYNLFFIDNVLVISQPGLAPLSPYLNFDPSYLPASQPEFIFPEGAVKQRGRLELAFSQIGAACIIGAGLGGGSGLYKGIKATTLAGQTGNLRRTQ